MVTTAMTYPGGLQGVGICKRIKVNPWEITRASSHQEQAALDEQGPINSALRLSLAHHLLLSIKFY
jgi:hypothetical protein